MLNINFDGTSSSLGHGMGHINWPASVFDMIAKDFSLAVAIVSNGAHGVPGDGTA